MTSAVSGEIISWQEAMAQVGDDEEFLRELLADLRTETQAQINAIAQIIANPPESPYHRISRAAHVIKGAAANLMCQQLRIASLNLEQAGTAAHDASQGTTVPPAELVAAVQTSFAAFQQAAQNFFNFLQSIGV